ncbi:MAG: endonuclease domain-containing protein [Gammaproteobacteria bacterium]|nr:endonuclease domain-containing protein [Gammaproteobacteria bacterium]
MLSYSSQLRMLARRLRLGMTDAELKLWSRLRRKQICGVQFYRQKPLGPYVVDFYAPKVQLIVEVDGSQHLTQDGVVSDDERDEFLRRQGLHVMRFDNLQVLQETDAVVAKIYSAVVSRMNET